LRLAATRKPRVTHQGGAWFHNTEPWGTWEIDHGITEPISDASQKRTREEISC
jgi:hypothetical protein